MANCLSRLVAGYLTDRIVYSKLMSGCGALLTLNLVTIYFVGEHFAAILVCVWLVYLLGFTHFTAIPAQVQYRVDICRYLDIMCFSADPPPLFWTPHLLCSRLHRSGRILLIRRPGCSQCGECPDLCICVDSVQVVMADDSNPDKFLIFFLTLAACSLLSVPATWLVSNKRKQSSAV